MKGFLNFTTWFLIGSALFWIGFLLREEWKANKKDKKIKKDNELSEKIETIIKYRTRELESQIKNHYHCKKCGESVRGIYGDLSLFFNTYFRKMGKEQLCEEHYKEQKLREKMEQENKTKREKK